MPIKINHIDLFTDWLEITREDLENQNYSVSHLGDDDVSILFFTLESRKIESKIRNILKSDVFECPSNLASGLSLLENKIRNGEDLKPHQSRSLKNLENIDGLLFHWRIYHFHLGTVMESDEFINRTGPLLYALIDNENIYFIQILQHGAWTEKELLRIVHRNWPDTIATYRAREDADMSVDFSNGEIAELRNANINTMVKLEDGVIYLGPGGGTVASGNSLDAVRSHIYNRKKLNKIQEYFNNNIENILIEYLGSLDTISNHELIFKLKKEDDGFKLIEINNNIEIAL